jgi:hypothetical protein
MNKLSQILNRFEPDMSQKSITNIHIRQPILSSHLQFEMDYLNSDDREYLLEWYPLYIDNVPVPSPLSRFLSRQEKRERLELIHQALYESKSVYTISIVSLFTTLCMSLCIIFLLMGILFLLWKRRQYIWMIVWLYILI